MMDWDVEAALVMARKPVVDYTNEKPYAFAFFTKRVDEESKESSVIARSGTYYINGTVKDISQIEANPEDGWLARKMKDNGWDKIVFIRNSFGQRYRPFRDRDIELWDDN